MQARVLRGPQHIEDTIDWHAFIRKSFRQISLALKFALKLSGNDIEARRVNYRPAASPRHEMAQKSSTARAVMAYLQRPNAVEWLSGGYS